MSNYFCASPRTYYTIFRLWILFINKKVLELVETNPYKMGGVPDKKSLQVPLNA